MSARRLPLPSLFLVLCSALLAACSGESAPTADAPRTAAAAPDATAVAETLLVTGARIWTGDPERPWAEALAVRGDEVLAIGDASAVTATAGDGARILDAAGGMVVPGFVDAHVHFATGGAALASVQLRDAGTPEEFTRRIGEYAATLEPGEWILGGDWDHENWGGELPRRAWIDAVTADNPVWIRRLDGHMGLANSAALTAAGVSADTDAPAGGEIVRDADGEPTGVLKDNAMGLVGEAVPAPSEAQMERNVEAAMAHVAARGVTTVHDMGDWASMEAYQRLHARGDLDTRIYSVVPLADVERLKAVVADLGTGDEWLRRGGLKGFMDGSLGSHTAAFLEPFTDAPDDRGLLVSDPADIERWARSADAAGLQLMIHAIGDRAISILLDIYAGIVADHGERDRRLRIEHAQHIAPADLPRFAELGVIASMQPYHAIDDGRWAERVIGPERAETTYAFASLLESGARVAFGSDWFVAPPTPIEGIYAAVTRRTLDGENPDGWVPEQKVSVEQALTAYTNTGAYASFEEDRKGRLAPGYLADFVVLDRDLTAIPPETIRDARVLHTFVGGRVVHSLD
jgi:predicted amidohydrolase YtcJ